MVKRLKRFVGPGRAQLNKQDVLALLRNGGLVIAGNVLTHAYEYLSKTDLGPNGYIYMLVAAGALDAFRRFARDNTKAQKK